MLKRYPSVNGPNGALKPSPDGKKAAQQRVWEDGADGAAPSAAPAVLKASPEGASSEAVVGSAVAVQAAPPSMRPLAPAAGSRLHLMAVGCGGAGGRLAATFSHPPHGLAQHVDGQKVEGYEVTPIILDTNEHAYGDLIEHWGYQGRFLPLPGITVKQVFDLMQQESAVLGSLPSSLPFAGAGRYTLLGREIARRYLMAPEDERESDPKQKKKPREAAPLRAEALDIFGDGLRRVDCLLTFHSLVGGTGSGTSPLVMQFMWKEVIKRIPGLVLDVAVMPSWDELRGMRFYPKNVITSLHYLLNEPEAPDGVVLVDNDRLRKLVGREDTAAYNALVQDALLPIALAPTPRFLMHLIGEQPDFSNMRTVLRPGGIGLPRLCTLGFTRDNPVPVVDDTQTFMRDMVRRAVSNAFVELEGSPESPGCVDSIIAVVAAPPPFYDWIRGRWQWKKYVPVKEFITTELLRYLRRPGSARILVYFLQANDAKAVTLSLLLSGVRPPKLHQIWTDITQKAADPQRTVEQELRALDEQTLLRLAFEDIRRGLEDLGGTDN